ncbi:hypothetical protein CLOM_g21341 [Closterium sp. NIES-68]|nr:hypothetical protein CLOM_g21341 [Closterium sp. NIES-68]
MGVSPSVPGAGGWERKAEAEGQGYGEVWSFEAEGWEDGNGMEPVSCSISSQGEESLSVPGVGVWVHCP